MNIYPYPQIGQTTVANTIPRKRRTAEVARVLTATPYKDERIQKDSVNRMKEEKSVRLKESKETKKSMQNFKFPGKKKHIKITKKAVKFGDVRKVKIMNESDSDEEDHDIRSFEVRSWQRCNESSFPRVRVESTVRMSRVRVQIRRTRVRVQQVLSPSPGFCVSSPNPSPEEKN